MEDESLFSWKRVQVALGQDTLRLALGVGAFTALLSWAPTQRAISSIRAADFLIDDELIDLIGIGVWVALALATWGAYVGWKRGVHRLPAFAVALAVHACVIGGGWTAIDIARSRVIEDIVARAEPVAVAIRRFEKERGEPPLDLNALVPDYLPKLPRPVRPNECELLYGCDLLNKHWWIDGRNWWSGATCGIEYAPLAEQHPVRELRSGQARRGDWVLTYRTW